MSNITALSKSIKSMSIASSKQVTLSIVPDKWNSWTLKSQDVAFMSTQKCVGNGEAKLAKELDLDSLGGQNKTADLVHPTIGDISVKDFTKDNCTLGTDGCNRLRVIFRSVIYLLSNWAEKYAKDDLERCPPRTACPIAIKYKNKLDKPYGGARRSLLDGIDRWELADGGKKKKKGPGNLMVLVSMFEELKKDRIAYPDLESMSSEYIDDILKALGSNTLQDQLDAVVRQEAEAMTLIIVHKDKGWLLCRDVERLRCPRITRGAPRIDYIEL